MMFDDMEMWIKKGFGSIERCATSVGFVRATRSTTIPAFEWEKGDKKESFVLDLLGRLKECG